MTGRLSKAPLIEAILEIKWQLEPLAPDTFRDPVYRVLIGRLYDRIRSRFRYLQELPFAQFPDELTSYVAKQQFRKERNGWPLVQLGPGVFTLNFTSPYEWEDFKDTAQFVLPQLVDAYAGAGIEQTGQAPRVTSVLLRYINAVDFDWGQNNALEFMREKLHTAFSLPTQMLKPEVVAGPPASINLQVGHPLQKPRGQGIVRFATGQRGQTRSLIWELIVQALGEDAPQLVEMNEFVAWVTAAHDNVIEPWFFELVEGELHSQFT